MTPRLSAILPTADRRRFIPAAIAQFLAQSREDAELVILDDGADAIADLIPGDARIRYHREDSRRNIGDKRNRLCELARGEIMVHWDDDDWHAADRLTRQLAALDTSGADICGCDRLLFLSEDGSAAWEYVYSGARPWVAGGTLCYRRSAWESRRFPALRSGEDTRWIYDAPRDRVHVMADNSFYVARVHPGNTSPKGTRGACWHRRDPVRLKAMIAATASVPSASPATLRDLTVVIPHGGSERLALLGHTLAMLRQQLPDSPLIVVEQGELPLAREIAEAAGAHHVPVPVAGIFEKARVLNAGAHEAETPFVLWHDNDLVAAPGFYERALDEMSASQLDFLIPYHSIGYLSEDDSRAWIAGGERPASARPLQTLRSGSQVAGGMGLIRRSFLQRYGGLDERFRGWGGEDNAWWHKASLLGRSAISQVPAQHLWHLYHPDSGGLPGGSPQRNNPHYARNLAILDEVLSLRTTADFLAKFPPTDVPQPQLPVFLYWEGPCPEWIARCRETIVRHGGNVRLLDRAGFEALRTTDRDIDLDPLLPAHRADYARAWLLAHHGGIWLDSDCILMRSLDEIRALAAKRGFVAHRDRQGYFPNGFMAAAPGNPVAARFHAAVAARVRKGGQLGWIELGGEPLTQLLKLPGTDFEELPCAAIQPICWSRPERFFHRASASVHEAAFDSGAITYMMSNTQVTTHAGTHATADLLMPDSFFSYLIARSLGQSVAAATGRSRALAEAGGADTPAKVFANYHRAAVVRREDSLSGPGSSLEQTAVLRRELPRLLSELGVTTMLDAGCGDHRWLAHTDLGAVSYIGMDIVPDLILRNRALGLPGRRFVEGDFTTAALPQADLVLTRDTLVHYDFATALQAIANIRRSGAQWMLVTSFPAHPANIDAELGGWRPLNLTLAPFHLPPPVRLLNEQCTEHASAYRDKALGLWCVAA